MPRRKKKIAVLDLETDPFQYNRVPKPFAAEFYCDDCTIVTWGDDCITELMQELSELPDDYIIYAHNGGKFDFFMMFEYIDNGAHKIINGRLVSATIQGRHTLRDSYAIMPVPLAQGPGRKAKWKKLMERLGDQEAFYSMFERDTREKHKAMILEYLHDDCLDLYEMVTTFIETFGVQLTIGGTAIRELLKMHPRERISPRDDEYYRQFYFGGRVQCFEAGIIEGPWEVVDCNSMYPSVMKNFNHPMNGRFKITDKIPDDPKVPFFAQVELTNRNALPWRTMEQTENGIKYGPIDFNRNRGLFHVCGHELHAALEYGLVDIHKVHYVSVAEEYGTFSEFVDHFYNIRMEAKARGDVIYTLLWKLVLNSAYGKFGQDPTNYYDWYFDKHITSPHELVEKGYAIWNEYEDFDLWCKPARIHSKSYYDVSIAASITSAARAELLRAIQQSEEPIYCDTDSVICRRFTGERDEMRLGAWKVEAQARFAAIAGKKLYALYNERNGDPVKLASKGIRATLPGIVDICEGGEFEHASKAPTFSFRGKNTEPKFIKRTVRKTA